MNANDVVIVSQHFRNLFYSIAVRFEDLHLDARTITCNS